MTPSMRPTRGSRVMSIRLFVHKIDGFAQAGYLAYCLIQAVLRCGSGPSSQSTILGNLSPSMGRTVMANACASPFSPMIAKASSTLFGKWAVERLDHHSMASWRA